MPQPLVTVKTCSNAFESAFLKAYLEGNGIRTWDTGEQQKAWLGRYSMLARGTRIQVLPKDAARARKLLENPPEFHMPEEAEDETSGASEALALEFDEGGNLLKCPNCGSENIEELTTSPVVRLVLTILFLGLPLLFSQKRAWICRDCDWDSHRS